MKESIIFISDDTRINVNRIYNFKTGNVKTACRHEGWQISVGMKVLRMALCSAYYCIRRI